MKFQDVPFSPGTFFDVGSSKVKRCSKDKTESSEKVMEESADEITIATQEDGLFSCPTEGCVLTYQKHSNLEKHMFYGKCKLVTERETLLDQAKIMYHKKLLEGASQQPHIAAASKTTSSTAKSLEQGWALKSSKGGKRFNVNQKSYLDDKFQLGQDTGHKADPTQVARDLRHAKRDNGDRRFKYDEFLTPQQIKSYFSRKAAKLKYKDDAATDNKAIEDQRSYSSAREQIIQEIHIQHPIIYDTYELCHMYKTEKIKKLSIALLRHICVYFDFDVSDLPERRKAPYIALISQLVLSCSCGGKA